MIVEFLKKYYLCRWKGRGRSTYYLLLKRFMLYPLF